jgi:hypothetical protein
MVNPAKFDEPVVESALGHPAAVEHHDLITSFTADAKRGYRGSAVVKRPAMDG